MPLTDIQRRVVAILKPFRTPHDYVAGGAALNRQWARLSDDMDIFRDYRGHLPHNIQPELDALRQAGLSIEVTTDTEWMVEVILRYYGFETKVQWLDEPETCRRFFPALDDDELGFRLHQADLAVNKVLCAARRRSAARDAVDLTTIVQNYAPLGPLVWALSGKDANLTPPRAIRAIRDIAFGYSDEEIRSVRMERGHTLTRTEVRQVLEPALDLAAEYCDEAAPIELPGHLFVNETETPMAARAEDIARGIAKAIPVRDFTIIPTVHPHSTPQE